MTTASSLLTHLVSTQQADDAAVRFPAVEDNARRVIAYAAHFVDPVLLPVGEAANRLLALVDNLAAGALEVPMWCRAVRDRQVLLVGTVTTSLVEFDMLAEVVRRAGAAHVHGCALDVAGSTQSTLDSFVLLSQEHDAVNKTA